MTIQRMDNVLIVVDDLEAAKAFFAELGMELEGETTVEGPWVDQTGHSRIMFGCGPSAMPAAVVAPANRVRTTIVRR